MSTTVQLPLTNCCVKSDGTYQGTPGCNCPSVLVVWSTTIYKPFLVGWEELTPSTPPRGFRHYAISGAGITYWITDEVTHATTFTDTLTPGLTTTPSWGYNATTGSLENIGAMDYASSANPGTPGCLGDNLAPLNADENVTSGSTYNPFSEGIDPSLDCTLTILSNTSFKIQAPNTTVTHVGSGGIHTTKEHIDGGTMVITLVDEDTDDDALTRALAAGPDSGPFSGVNYVNTDGSLADTSAASINETRNDVGTHYDYIKTQYALLFDDLIVGMTYKWTIIPATRTAKNDLSDGDSLYGSTWTPGTPITGTFVASATQAVIGGSWTDLNSDGLMTYDEITPGTDLALSKGYENAIAFVYCEAVYS